MTKSPRHIAQHAGFTLLTAIVCGALACSGSGSGDAGATGGSASAGATGSAGAIGGAGAIGQGGFRGTGGTGGTAGTGSTAGATGTDGGGVAGQAGAINTGGGGIAGQAGAINTGDGGIAGQAGATNTGGGGIAGQAGATNTGDGGIAGQAGAANTGGGGIAGQAGAGAATGSAGAGGATATGGTGGGAASSYNPCPTNGDPCRILPFGASITYGYITVEADKASPDPSIDGKDSHGGYRVKLFADALVAGQNITFTGTIMNGPTLVSGVAFPPDNEGHIGYTIDSSNGMGVNDPTLLANAFQVVPHIVLVHIGTNDVLASSGQAGMAHRLKKLIDALVLRAPQALIVVSTLIPLNPPNDALNAFNAKIPYVVAKEAAAGNHVVMIDMFTGFTLDLLSADGIHPNQMGYDDMGDKFYAALSSLLPKLAAPTQLAR